MKSRDDLIEAECAVVGGGLAGCATALELADGGKRVDLFVKETLVKGSASYLIAGGLAAVPLIEQKPLEGDSFELHVQETLAAGKGLNDPDVVRFCIERFFPDVIQWLIEKGVRFDTAAAGYHYSLHKEGGHSQNRIFHIQDSTGVSVMENLGNRVREHPNIRLHENHIAIDLITRNKLRRSRKPDACLGLYVYDITKDRVQTVACRGVFIATGGLGKVFLYTTNPDVATGDGLAMCHRAGLPLVNMEFVQFHPSVFYDAAAAHENERRFLLTEALRGAGAILKLRKEDKTDFVLQYDPLGSRATRDVVTRAEDMEMRKHGLHHLWLDCTPIAAEKLKTSFRNSYEYCLNRGFDLTCSPVPIVYAVHYCNGGVLVGRHGETVLHGCYVIGEASYTGLHGATRLASNSSPECVLYGRLAARHFLSNHATNASHPSIPLWNAGDTTDVRDKTTVAYYWETIRRTMTCLCGISRNEERLLAAEEVLSSVRKNIHEFYWHYRVSKDFLEVRNIAEVAMIVLESALARKESRACHFREDFPAENPKCRGLTVIRKWEKPTMVKLAESKLKP
ncbi:MAG: FAD-binding protein [Verrucomicrobia bacterium]|nr:FAD-binding protein [Verrucomicrobiota bacterium]